MPHFYLHVHNSSGAAEDDEGAELPDLDAARARAVEGIRSILSEEVLDGRLDLRGRVDIADAEGRVLASVAYAEAVDLQLEDAAS